LRELADAPGSYYALYKTSEGYWSIVRSSVEEIQQIIRKENGTLVGNVMSYQEVVQALTEIRVY